MDRRGETEKVKALLLKLKFTAYSHNLILVWLSQKIFISTLKTLNISYYMHSLVTIKQKNCGRPFFMRLIM